MLRHVNADWVRHCLPRHHICVTCASATVAACLFFPQTIFPALGNALDVTLSIIVSVSATLWKAYMYVFTNVGPVATLTLACSAGAALTICVQVLSRHGMLIVLSRAARFAGDLLWALARSVNRRQSGTQKSEPELCAICLEGEGSVRCTAETHSVCIECFNRYAREWITNGDPRLRQEREGRLVCPCHLPEAGACEGIFDTQSLALHLSSTDFQTYDEHRRDEMRRVEARKLHADFVGSVREMANRLKQSAPGMSRELLARQLRDSIPGARMCGRCSHGPIEHYACSSLTTHARDAYNGNRCPKCDWFSADISAWPPWDGNLPEEAAGSADFETAAASSRSLGAEGTARRMRAEENQRLRQIEEDHELAMRLQMQVGLAPLMQPPLL